MARMSENAVTNALLRDLIRDVGGIKGDIGEINGRLAIGSERHRDFAKSLDAINVRGDAMQIEIAKISPLVETVTEMKTGFDKIAPMAEVVSTMKPQVKELMDFKTRIAAIMIVASGVIGTATWFAWEGLKWFFPDAKALIARLFH
jgi:hypothetical protein